MTNISYNSFMTNLDSILKSKDITLPTKIHLDKTMVFPVGMYKCKKGWVPKNWCLWTVVLEKTLESPLDCKEIQPVNLKGNKHWIFIGRTDAEAEAPVHWLPDAKSQLTGKKWRQKEKGVTEGEHHPFKGHEFKQTLEDSGGHGSLVCCNPWGHRVGHDLMTE